MLHDYFSYPETLKSKACGTEAPFRVNMINKQCFVEHSDSFKYVNGIKRSGRNEEINGNNQ